MNQVRRLSRVHFQGGRFEFAPLVFPSHAVLVFVLRSKRFCVQTDLGERLFLGMHFLSAAHCSAHVDSAFILFFTSGGSKHSYSLGVRNAYPR